GGRPDRHRPGGFRFGFALFLSAASVFFRDITYLWSIFLQVWFFLTPIVYSFDLVEQEAPSWARTALEFNPMISFVNAFRHLLYDAAMPPGGDVVKMLVAATLSISLGWLSFFKLGRRLPEEV
ncbi:MAG: ABC transporter permease, partial [Actinomycetota bacterium]